MAATKTCLAASPVCETAPAAGLFNAFQHRPEVAQHGNYHSLDGNLLVDTDERTQHFMQRITSYF
jgi:hypothetical protein